MRSRWVEIQPAGRVTAHRCAFRPRSFGRGLSARGPRCKMPHPSDQCFHKANRIDFSVHQRNAVGWRITADNVDQTTARGGRSKCTSISLPSIFLANWFRPLSHAEFHARIVQSTAWLGVSMASITTSKIAKHHRVFRQTISQGQSSTSMKLAGLFLAFSTART